MLVNDSWSGSRVTQLPDNERMFPSGISDERIGDLGNESQKPDIIIVMLGDNDWGHGVCVSEQMNTGNERNPYVFCDAYDWMLEKLEEEYPESRIYCCTLFTTYMPYKPSFIFPEELFGNSIEAYNSAIKKVAYRHNCQVIDLYVKQLPVSTIDGSHPDREGMRQIAK